MPRITPLHFYQYLKCPSWIWLDAFGDAEKRKRLHPLVVTLWKQGLLEEKNFIREQDFVTVDLDDLDEAADRTLELMRQGVQTIYRGVLLHDNWVARPDLLRKVEGHSNFGNYYYVACDIKRVPAIEDIHKLQGTFYAHILREMQGTQPVQGYVLTADGKTLSFLIEEVLDQFNIALAEIDNILRGEKPQPFLASTCRESPWLAECVREAEGCDDLSLIAHLTPEEYRQLSQLGIKTMSAFAVMKFDELKSRLPGITERRLERIHRQAQVLLDKKPVHLQQSVLPEAPVEIYIDIETDPLRDLEYLFGVLVREGAKATYYPFFAERPKQERETWEAFIKFLDRYPNAPIYHYGNYETLVMRRLAQKYGHVLNTLGRAVDIASVVSRDAVFPVYFYSLKDLARVLGFEWRHPEASGLNAIVWYHKWIETENKKIQEDLLAYNEDDVRATLLLKDWLVGE